ncbi:calcium-binding protein P-like [Solea senegalensis]|uniref:Calcium-binding protein P-like n=1 Tax=Solea senegalensis TaxID=28829 RepID=A0AAV6QIX8_SOLSE|nr:calcium-binding protein P-like [Solea senegalensis]XP_043902011.1 calcium-binding protein P-like [Solea senegalensis]KAG7490311.1 calcium-binding protein P-like [Solea senegalensis]KAG7512356.1 calcium-binding protein P-like [Solea senegalensis]
MGKLCEVAVVALLIMVFLNTESTWAKKSGGFSSSGSKGKPSSTNRGGSHSKPSSSQPGNYPRQPQTPNRNPNPYPAGGSYPGAGNTNPGGYPRQPPASNPGAGSYPNQGGYPNQNPGRGNPNQNPGGGYPNQYPAGGGYPAGGYPNQNPGRGYPNQNPGGGYPNQYPAGGGYPAGGYPNQNPGRGYPNQYPAGGGYPAGGYPNQYPGRGYPNQYPAGGGYPAAGGGYPGGYPNWNPNNKIHSPHYGGGGGGYGHGGYGMGGSPFSRSVQNMGYKPKSSGFAKKAIVAAGVGAVAGMAVGYGLGRFPRPHFNFRSPEEEHYYNNYMYRRYGSRSTDEKDYGRDFEYKIPPRAESYDSFIERCMNRSDLLKNQGNSSSGGDDDTVGIEEIGYPALIEQMKMRRCVENFMVYSEQFLVERKAEQQMNPRNRSSLLSCGLVELLTSLAMLLSSMLVLQ